MARPKSRKSLRRGKAAKGPEEPDKLEFGNGCVIPRYVKVVDPFAAWRLLELIAEINDTFSLEQLAVFERWQRYAKERAEEAALRAAESRRKKEEGKRRKEVEPDAGKRRKTSLWY